MNTNQFPGRTFYRCSGRVTWTRFIPWVLVLTAGAAMGALLLTILFLVGFYLIFIVPLLVALGLAVLARLAIAKMHCRNGVLAALLGFCAGFILYFGYHYLDMVHRIGPESAAHIEWLPEYIRFRMATQVTRDIHDSSKDESRPNRTGDVVFNWIFFAGESCIVLGFTTVAAFRRSRHPYCEACQQWMSREITQMEPAKETEVLEALRTSSPGSLATLCTVPAHATFPNTTIALEFCPSIKAGTKRDCPIFLSLKRVTGQTGGVGFDPFDTSKGKVLLHSLELTPSEVPAFAPRFSFLEGIVGRSAVAALVPELERAESPQKSSDAVAVVEPVPSEFAGKVLTRKTAWLALALGLGLFALVFASMAALIGGIAMVFPSAGQPHPSPANKALGLLLLGVGGLSFLVTLCLVFFNPSYWSNRYLLNLARREFSRRTGCLVQPNDVEALFVEVVPKMNWGKMMLENAADLGFLALDRGRKQILFEGANERWRIPANAITYCEVEEFVQGKGTAGATRFYFVVLRANRPNQFWEAPVRERKATGKFLGGRRKKDARKLCAAIKEMAFGSKSTEMFSEHSFPGRS